MSLLNLPNELYFLTIDYLDESDLRSLIRVDRHFYDLIGPLLYKIAAKSEYRCFLDALFRAVVFRNETMLQILLERGPEAGKLPKGKSSGGRARNQKLPNPFIETWLYQLSEMSDATAVRKRLLEQGVANIPIYHSCLNKSGVRTHIAMTETPLHFAVKMGNKSLLLLLLEHGVNVDAHSIDHRHGRIKTPLCYAARMHRPDIVRLLLERGADRFSSIVRDKDKPLCEAMYGARLNKAQFKETFLALLQGIDVNTPYSYHSILQETPLCRLVRCKGDDVGVVRSLLKMGADVTGTVRGRTDNELTALHVAIMAGNYKVARLLVHRGANVNEGREYAKYLSINPRFPKVISVTPAVTPIELATKCWSNGINTLIRPKESVETVRYMLERAAHDFRSCEFHATPLHIASACMDADCIRFLLEKGFAVNARNKLGRTPLFYATEGVKQVLLDHGATI